MQQRPAILGVEPVLQFRDARELRFEQAFGLGAVSIRRTVGGVESVILTRVFPAGRESDRPGSGGASRISPGSCLRSFSSPARLSSPIGRGTARKASCYNFRMPRRSVADVRVSPLRRERSDQSPAGKRNTAVTAGTRKSPSKRWWRASLRSSATSAPTARKSIPHLPLHAQAPLRPAHRPGRWIRPVPDDVAVSQLHVG